MATREIRDITVDSITFNEIITEGCRVISFDATEGKCQYSWEHGLVKYSDPKKEIDYEDGCTRNNVDSIVLFSLKNKITQLKKMAAEIANNGQG